VWAATGRVIHRWHLDSMADMHRAEPEKYGFSDEEIAALTPGTMVKLLFRMKDGWCEGMWVEILAMKKRHIVGALRNRPAGIPKLSWGDEITFKGEHVVDVMRQADASFEPAAAFSRPRVVDHGRWTLGGADHGRGAGHRT
jgi:uncharacterized protein YegJ (DUF2314 family)